MCGFKKGFFFFLKNFNFVIFNVLWVNLWEKSYLRFFYDIYVIILIVN